MTNKAEKPKAKGKKKVYSDNNPYKRMMGRPRKIQSLEQMQECFLEYFEPPTGGAYHYNDNAELVYHPTINGLAIACGIHRSRLHEYLKLPEFQDAIKDAKAICEDYHEKGLRGTNVTGHIFWLKSIAGWRDNEEQVKEKEKEPNYTFNFEVTDAKKDIKVTRGKKKEKKST